MRTAFYFILTCFIATGAYLSGLNSANPVPGIAIAFGVWGLFLWGYYRRMRR